MNTTKTILLIAATLLISVNSLFAQYGMGKTDDIIEMKNRTLIVVLASETDKEVMDKLTFTGHKEQIPFYQKRAKEFNESLKASFQNYWPFKQTIIFKEWEEVKALYEAKNTDYAVALVFQVNFTYNRNPSPFLDWNDSVTISRSTSYLKVTLIEDLKKTFGIGLTGLANFFPTKTDIISGIYGLEYYMDVRMRGVGGLAAITEAKLIDPKLKSMTLMIRKSDLAQKFTTDSVKKYYSYAYKVLDDSTMDKNILDKVSGMAYIMTAPFQNDGQITYTQEIFDCETGDWLGAVFPDMMAVQYAGKAGRGKIDKKVFLKLTQQINGK